MYDIVLNYDQIEASDSAEIKFHLCLPFDAMFDFNFPFRPLLAFIAECLRRQSVSAEVKLPDYFEFEDFVTGEFIVDGRRLESTLSIRSPTFRFHRTPRRTWGNSPPFQQASDFNTLDTVLMTLSCRRKF